MVSDSLNSAQRDAVTTPNKSVLVLSGAGTGKTRVIVGRFLHLVQNGVSPYNIMCVTFSNKAANEIMHRLSNSNIDINSIWVGTFHKIALKILQIYGKLDPKTSIIDEGDSKKIADQLRISDHLQTIQRMKDYSDVQVSIAAERAYRMYNDYLEKHKFLDFGDILLKTITLLEENEEVRTIVQSRFEAVLVDEYQDTSKAQYLLIKLMLGEHASIFCVGDDNQAIYSWRGACIDNILKFNTFFPQAKTYLLEENYRSTKPILRIAGKLIENNTQRINKTVWSEKEGEKVIICYSKNEGEFIAREISKLPENYTVGILVRTVTLIKNIEEALVSAGISYKMLGGTKFHDRLEIKISIGYLKAIFNNDILAIEKIINYPRRGIGEKSIEKILSVLEDGGTIADGLRLIKKDALAANFESWAKLTGRPGDILKIILIESGCWELFKNEERLENVMNLIVKMNFCKTIEEFLMNFFLFDDEDTSKVSIMTIHGAKGLEFDAVFVPGMSEGTFPHIRVLQEGDIQEERRLAYVAFTRAREKLFLSYNLGFNLSKKVFGPSRFLFNLPNELIDYKTG